MVGVRRRLLPGLVARHAIACRMVIVLGGGHLDDDVE